MIIKTIVPNLGDTMHYIGKPVLSEYGVRIGMIIDVIDDGDCIELLMDIQGMSINK